MTHGIVEKGVFFTDEKVIPIQALERGAGDEILTLRPEIAPADLPDVEEPHYVELDTDTRNRLVPHASRAYAWSHPVLTTTGYPVYPATPRTSTPIETEENVPEGRHAIHKGTEVFSADGADVGRIRGVGLSDDGRLAFITMDPGFFHDERIIPEHWIENVSRELVQLAVNGGHCENSSEMGLRIARAGPQPPAARAKRRALASSSLPLASCLCASSPEP